MKNKKVATVVRDDRAMIENPDRWPCWPFLPLKISIEKCATLLVTENNVLKLAPTNMFSLCEAIDKGETIIWRDVTVDELINEGWRVD